MDLFEGDVRIIGKGASAGDPLFVSMDGVPITGETLPSGGVAAIGWLSYIRSTVQSLVNSIGTISGVTTVLGLLRRIFDRLRVRRSGSIVIDTGMITIAPLIANEWRDLIVWSPGNVAETFVPKIFGVYASGQIATRFFTRLRLGNFTSSGANGTFSQVSVADASDPEEFFHATHVITTPFTGGGGAGTAYTVTVTYLNQDNVSKTGSFALTRSAPVGTRTRLTMAAGDVGVRAITAMTGDGGSTAGVAAIEGSRTLGISAAIFGGTAFSQALPEVGLKCDGNREIGLAITTTNNNTISIHGYFVGDWQTEE